MSVSGLRARAQRELQTNAETEKLAHGRKSSRLAVVTVDADELLRLLDALERASGLLDGAQCAYTDPGLSRRWGQQRRRLRDVLLDLGVRS